MHLTVLVLFTATVLLDNVNGNDFPPAVSHIQKRSTDPPRYKRHDTEQCVDDKLDTAFSGDNSNLLLNCKRSARWLIDLDDSSYSQSTINSMFNTFCKPECGNVIIDAFNDCEHFEETGVYNLKDFLIGLCGTNQNGDICYEIYSSAYSQFYTERSCHNIISYTQCTSSCRSTLSQGVRVRGCCLNAYHNYVTNGGWDYYYNYDPSDLYDACNVDLPTGCNNSPITGSDVMITGSSVMTQVALVTLMSASIFSVLLG